MSGRRGFGTAILLVVSACFGAFWIVRMSVLDGFLGIPKMHFYPPSWISLAVVRQLGPLVPPRGRVFSNDIGPAMAGGLLTPGFDWHVWGASYMLDRPRVEGLFVHHERARCDLDREDLEALEVGWIVLAHDDLTALSDTGRAALRDPARFRHLFEVRSHGDWRTVYRVVR